MSGVSRGPPHVPAVCVASLWWEGENRPLLPQFCARGAAAPTHPPPQCWGLGGLSHGGGGWGRISRALRGAGGQGGCGEVPATAEVAPAGAEPPPAWKCPLGAFAFAPSFPWGWRCPRRDGGGRVSPAKAGGWEGSAAPPPQPSASQCTPVHPIVSALTPPCTPQHPPAPHCSPLHPAVPHHIPCTTLCPLHPIAPSAPQNTPLHPAAPTAAPCTQCTSCTPRTRHGTRPGAAWCCSAWGRPGLGVPTLVPSRVQGQPGCLCRVPGGGRGGSFPAGAGGS